MNLTDRERYVAEALNNEVMVGYQRCQAMFNSGDVAFPAALDRLDEEVTAAAREPDVEVSIPVRGEPDAQGFRPLTYAMRVPVSARKFAQWRQSGFMLALCDMAAAYATEAKKGGFSVDFLSGYRSDAVPHNGTPTGSAGESLPSLPWASPPM